MREGTTAIRFAPSSTGYLQLGRVRSALEGRPAGLPDWPFSKARPGPVLVLRHNHMIQQRGAVEEP
jgi:hypothetical protein